MPVDLITVEVVATVAERADLEALLEGWEVRADEPDGVTWLRDQLSGA